MNKTATIKYFIIEAEAGIQAAGHSAEEAIAQLKAAVGDDKAVDEGLENGDLTVTECTQRFYEAIDGHEYPDYLVLEDGVYDLRIAPEDVSDEIEAEMRKEYEGTHNVFQSDDQGFQTIFVIAVPHSDEHGEAVDAVYDTSGEVRVEYEDEHEDTLNLEGLIQRVRYEYVGLAWRPGESQEVVQQVEEII